MSSQMTATAAPQVPMPPPGGDTGRIIADGPKNAVLAALRGEQAKTGTVPGMRSKQPVAAAPAQAIVEG